MLCAGWMLFAVDSATKIPIAGASYTYTITLRNGAKNLPTSGSTKYLKVGISGTSAPAATITCPTAGNVLGANNLLNATTHLAASATIVCQFDVEATAAYAAAGKVPGFNFTAAWVTTLNGDTLVGDEFYIPPLGVPALPVHTNNRLSVATPTVVTTGLSRYINGKQAPQAYSAKVCNCFCQLECLRDWSIKLSVHV